MERKIIVGFISSENPQDRQPQSGTTFNVYHSLLKQGFIVKWIPVKTGILNRWLLMGMKLIEKIFHIPMPGKRLYLSYLLSTKGLSRQTLLQCDVLFAPFTLLNGKLLYGKPLIYMSEAVFSQMIGYYWTQNLSPFVINQGNKTQRITLETSTHLVFPSNWAAQAAIHDYKQSASKISIIEFGANMDDKSIIPHQFTYNNHLHILFIGIDWERKGGRIAVETTEWLNQNGIPSTLHIIGGNGIEEEVTSLSFIDYVGSLNKNIPKQYNKFVELLHLSHCMLLPTIAECAGIVFCESSANGIPIFSHDTGGVSNYVQNGMNGYLLPLGSTGKDFGKKIKDTLLNGEIEKMSKSAIELYYAKLNWNTWGEKVGKIINSLV